MPKDPTDPVARLCEEWLEEKHYQKHRGIPVRAIQIGVIVALAVVFIVFLGLIVFYRPS
jgi:hypothetical protein